MLFPVLSFNGLILHRIQWANSEIAKKKKASVMNWKPYPSHITTSRTSHSAFELGRQKLQENHSSLSESFIHFVFPASVFPLREWSLYTQELLLELLCETAFTLFIILWQPHFKTQQFRFNGCHVNNGFMALSMARRVLTSHKIKIT